MTEKGLKYLSDIVIAIELVEDFTSSVSTFDEFENDLKTKSAVERQLGIIGEAVNKFDLLHPEIELKHTRAIIGFRNRLIHGYDAVDSAIVWTIVRKHLVPLKEEVIQIIKAGSQ